MSIYEGILSGLGKTRDIVKKPLVAAGLGATGGIGTAYLATKGHLSDIGKAIAELSKAEVGVPVAAGVGGLALAGGIGAKHMATKLRKARIDALNKEINKELTQRAARLGLIGAGTGAVAGGMADDSTISGALKGGLVGGLAGGLGGTIPRADLYEKIRKARELSAKL